MNDPGLIGNAIIEQAKEVLSGLASLDLDSKIATINELRAMIHQHSPFAREPVDFVRWLPFDMVEANDYNPNSVAPPEMKLLETSILEDGYTQPVVGWRTEKRIIVVDGFHRNRVGKESSAVRKRVYSHLPVVQINDERDERGDRMASTIRHNRARGKHKVEAMSDIVIELKRRNWTDDKISNNLGMDKDEILRLTQITGLAEMFKDSDFSASWEIDEMPEPTDETLVEEQV